MTGLLDTVLETGTSVCLRLEEIHPKGRMEISNCIVDSIDDKGIYINIPLLDTQYLEGRRVEVLWEKDSSLYCLRSRIEKCFLGEALLLRVGHSNMIRCIEKENYLRLKKPINIEFRPNNLDSIFISTEGSDISGKGVVFITDFPLLKGQKLDMLIEVPIFPYLDVSVIAEVDTIEELRDSEGHNIKVRFLKIDHIDEKRLLKYLLDQKQPSGV